MGLGILRENMRAVGLGINLRGGKAGMAQQFLNGAKIGTSRQQMRGKGMAQRMWCGAVCQSEAAAHALHQELDDAC